MVLFRRRRKYQRKKGIEWELNPESAREIIAISLLVLGFLFAFSLFDLAGGFGEFLAYLIKLFFGYFSYVVVLGSIVLGILLFMPQRVKLKASSFLGMTLLILVLPGLIHLFVDKAEAFEVAKLGKAGGIIGFAVSYIFFTLFGLWPSLIIFLATSLIALMLVFSLTLSSAIASIKNFFAKKRQPPVEIRTGVPVVTMAQKRVAQGEVAPQVSTPGTYQLPPYSLLEPSYGGPTSGDVNKNLSIIAKTLAQFGINVTMSNVNIGPTVTQYTLKPAEGVKLAQITARANDLALALAAHPIRIEAPIPGKALVGIEVPNQKRATVSLREIFESREWREHRCKLPLALGVDVAGAPVVVNLEKMPHLLVAGSTGSGKTIFLNTLILSLLMSRTPSEVKFILIDPKRVEFVHYNDLPHLLAPVVVDLDKTVSTLKWTVAEMERRYKIFQEAHKRDIDVYNQSEPEKMPYVVVIIDELADLMALAASEVESQIVRIAQMARATGIHLVLATQRPSVDVITGLIKANITARIAFAVASQVDSRTILDMAGAEKLLGDGDMLYQGSDIAKPRRIQGPLVKEKEIKRVTEFIKAQMPQVSYNEEVTEYKPEARALKEVPADELYEQAKEVVINARAASASLLQRRLRVGYTRAARLLDLLEQEGVIGPAEGSRPRKVLIEEGEKE